MILCIGTTPAAQRVMVFTRVVRDAVNRASSVSDGAAGKAVNVAKVLRLLGEQPLATGFVGGDRGEFVSAELRRLGVDCRFIPVPARTRECVTVIDRQAGTATELVEESRPVTPEDYGKLRQAIAAALPRCRAAVLSGTFTPGGDAGFYRACVELATAQGALSVVDAHGPALMAALQVRPGLVKPNRAELAASTGHTCGTESEVMAAMRVLQERGAARVVVTAGKEHAIAFDGTRFWRITPPAVAVLNPIGSGDAFAAALVSRILKGDDLGEASRWGAAAGAANALTWMPGELDPAAVKQLAAEVRVDRVL